MRISLRPFRLILRQIGLEVAHAKYCPSLTDRKVYETFLPDAHIKVIFDVGVNIGQTAKRFRANFLKADIFCFKPFCENFESLKRNLSRQPNTRPLQIALGDFSGAKDVLVDNIPSSQYNSLAPERQPLLQDQACTIERVNCITGDDFCKVHHIKRIDILKTDTEGFDVAVLLGFAGMLSEKKISAICIEVGFLSDTSHTPLRNATDVLADYGYGLAGFYESVYSCRGALEYTNALFVQEPG
jgi:FkbM family methyltransferase